MGTDPTGGTGRQLVRAAVIVLFVAWALAEAVHLLASVWLGLTVIGLTVAVAEFVKMGETNRSQWG